MVPVSVEDMHLRFFDNCWVEVLECDADFAKYLQSAIILLSLFEHLCTAQHGFQLSVITTLFFVQHELKELQGFLLELLLWGR